MRRNLFCCFQNLRRQYLHSAPKLVQFTELALNLYSNPRKYHNAQTKRKW